MIVVDTNVLVYAVGADHPLTAPARRLLDAAASGGITASTTVEVIGEFAHVRARRRGRADAAALARSFATLLGPLLSTTAADLDCGLDLWERHDSLGAFDSVLLAASERVDAQAIVTADRAMMQASSIPVVALADVDRLLT
jgi:Predicted nucleic acid-binding protein, contains PIN domain